MSGRTKGKLLVRPMVIDELRAARGVVADVLVASSRHHESSTRMIERAGGRDTVEQGLDHLNTHIRHLEDGQDARGRAHLSAAWVRDELLRLANDLAALATTPGVDGARLVFFAALREQHLRDVEALEAFTSTGAAGRRM